MDIPEDVAAIDVLARRHDFLSYLDGDPAQKPAMVEELDHSRSTVDRAIRALEDAGFVERTTGGYVTTLAGRLALERYDSFLAESGAILNAKSVLNALPPTIELPLAAATSGEVDAIEDEYQLFEVLAGELRTADQYRAVIPRMDDSRHVRLLHTQIQQRELEATLASPSAVYQRLNQEFPYIAADLQGASSFTGFETDSVDVGVVHATSDDRETALVVAYENQDVAGYLRLSAESAVSWAREYVRATLEDATETDALDGGDAQSLVQLDEQRLPATLRSQGFERIDDAYFDARTTIDPIAAWRAGVKLPEVATGYAVERTRGGSDERESMTERLLSALDAGTDTVLLGPPGSGKSTVCKQVAYEWFDSQRGAVFYRESGRGQRFEGVETLRRVLDQSAGQTLVVIEDAVRPEANAVFQTIRDCADQTDITFLLDARESEWEDPSIGTRSDPVRRSVAERVDVPRLDETEQRRILEHTASVLDIDGSVHPEDLNTSSDDAASMFLFFHRLARYADVLDADSADAPTTLDEHVDQVRAELVAVGDAALDVGVLANVLNAAGVGVYPEYLHALGAAVGHDTVRDAIEVLTGEVLFESDDAGYRMVHAAWSVRFLDRLLDAEGDSVAETRFGRAMTALLGLADDRDRREAVARQVDGDAPRLADVTGSPTEWVDDTVQQVFELGPSYPKLVDLYGTTHDGSLTLPEAAKRETSLQLSVIRGRTQYHSGNFEAAREEFDRVIVAATDPTESASVSEREGTIYARATFDLAEIDFRREEGAPLSRSEKALAAFQAVDDDPGIVAARLQMAMRLMHTGEYEQAWEQTERTLTLADEIGDKGIKAEALYNKGFLQAHSGAVPESRETLERSVELARASGKRQCEVEATLELGRVCRLLGDLRDAERYGRRGLETSQQLGTPEYVVAGYTLLGQCAIDRGRLDAAAQYLDQVPEESSRVGVRRQIAITLVRARLARAREDYKRSRKLFEEILQRGPEKTGARAIVGCHFHLARTDLAASDVERAREHAVQAVDLATELDGDELVARARETHGRVALEIGDLKTAGEQLEAAMERASKASIPIETARIRHGLGRLAHERGDDDRACELYEQALEMFREGGAARFGFQVVADLVELDGPKWYEVGAEMAADADLDDRAEQYRERAEQTADPQLETD